MTENTWKHMRERLLRTPTALGIGGILLGLLAGAGVERMLLSKGASAERGSIIHNQEKRYPLINPILSCEVADKESFQELKPIERELSRTIAKKKSDGSAVDVSVYLRLLNSGRWLGINENESYAPASLLKVLVMVAYEKAAEDDPSILRRTFVYGGARRPDESIETDLGGELTVGETYSVSTLLEKMVEKSSNPALYLLLDNISPTVDRAVNELYSDLNIPTGGNARAREDFLTPRTYSMIFRVLFGSTYLGHGGSESALRLLSKTNFTDGIVKYLPPSLTVAHKFGAYAAPANDLSFRKKSDKELHDCGIVYYPEHPYLLCVMTRGKNYADLEETIARVSETAHASIEQFFKKSN